jgi:BirA family biotin operon repressor/biotin-[acetyl-CoA-carboxylase] ligase
MSIFFPQHIASLCRETAQQVAIEVVAETGSTNADLLSRVDHLAVPTLLIAETQTAGKGRAGRSWLSAPSASLTCSLAWKFQRPVQDLVGLPLVVGVVIAEVLAQFGIDATLKWPNDVLKEGKKLAGILIETAAPTHLLANQTWAIIGIGVNLTMPAKIAAKIDRPTADIHHLQSQRNELMAALLNNVAEAMFTFEHQGFPAFMHRWNALHAYADQAVVILDHGQAIHEGIAIGTDHLGRLLLNTKQGTVAIMAGDVSLRPQEN